MTIKAIVQKIEGLEHHIVAWVHGEEVKLKQVATTDLAAELETARADLASVVEVYHAAKSRFDALTAAVQK